MHSVYNYIILLTHLMTEKCNSNHLSVSIVSQAGKPQKTHSIIFQFNISCVVRLFPVCSLITSTQHPHFLSTTHIISQVQLIITSAKNGFCALFSLYRLIFDRTRLSPSSNSSAVRQSQCR